MSGIPGASAELAAIHTAFAAAVKYTGAGLTNATVAAVRSEGPADAFQGPGSTAREVAFEVLKAALPSAPGKGDAIVEGDGAGQAWEVIDITDRDDVNAWHLIAEQSA
ncbi:MAG: hypothetical protein AB7G24_00800 [Novosphingobium sp.]